MKNFEELQNFIRNNKDWKVLLKKEPFFLKSISECPYHKGWYMLMYNLFESDMDEIIIKQCRGTVVDDNGNIICAPYLKFFNYDEPHADVIDWESAKIRHKIDGQLIKMFRCDERSYWVTNGGWSPESLSLENCINFKDGKELLNYVIGDDSWCENVPDGWTLMFEMVSPYTRIICEYDEPKLYLHGCRKSDGDEISPEDAKKMFAIPYDIPGIINCDNLSEIINMMTSWDGYKQEGVVVCDKNWKRIKIKCDDYINHKFEYLFKGDGKQAWKVWSSGEWDDIRNGEVKDKIISFNDKVHSMINDIDKLKKISDIIVCILYNEFGHESYECDLHKARYAQIVNKYYKKYASYMFLVYKNDNYKEYIENNLKGSYKNYLKFVKFHDEMVNDTDFSKCVLKIVNKNFEQT